MTTPIKGLTLWQPWASLCFSGWKKFETRSWATFYRGRLAIHAAERRCPSPYSLHDDLVELLCDEFGGHWATDLPRGCIIGVVNLTDCKSTEAFDVDAPERLCGDWGPGRFAWRFENQHKLKSCIAVSGRQSLWTLPEPAVARIVAEVQP